MNNETLNRLNAFIADYKKESEEKDAIIKKQNQTLLHINAELEAIKQHNPFDLVFITGSVENISNVINGQTEPIIDEGCVGCAGPCKVVDVAAKLQKELDDTTGKLVDSRKRCDYLSTKINEKQGLYDELERTCGDLRAELYDLKTHLPSNFGSVVTEKDSMIKRQGKIIEDFKTIETKETDRLHKIILDMDVTISDLMDNDRKINGFLDEYRVTVENRDKTIEELKDRNIEDLHELYDLYEAELRGLKADRTSIKSDRDIMFQNHHNAINKLWEDIRGLEVELSACKEDSLVLKKVVEIIKDDTIPNGKVPCIICNLVDAYLDAPEGPPEVKTIVVEVEYPVDGSRTIHLQNMRIAEQKQTIEKLKDDSAMLRKIVEIVKKWDDLSVVDRYSTSTIVEMRRLYNVVKEHNAAPEGQPETPIDEEQNIAVVLTFGEIL